MKSKRILSLILSFLMLVTLILPAGAFAENDALTEEPAYEEITEEPVYEEINQEAPIQENQEEALQEPEQPEQDVIPEVIAEEIAPEEVVEEVIPEKVEEEDLVVSATSIAFEITTQPEDADVEIGETAVFTVVATGEGLTYQWYFKNANQSKFTKTVTTPTYSVKMTDAVNGREVYCEITNANGDHLTTRTATMRLPLEIVTQPQSCKVSENEEATFTVSVKGGTEPYTYQWKYSREGGTPVKCTEVSATTPTLTIQAEKKDDGKQFLCVVTDANGKEVTSEAATLTVTPAVAVTSSDPAETDDPHVRKITVRSTVTGEYAQTNYMWAIQYSYVATFDEGTTRIEIAGPVSTGSSEKTWEVLARPNTNEYYRSILFKNGTDARNSENWICEEPISNAHQFTTGDISFTDMELNVLVSGTGYNYYRFTAPSAQTYTFTSPAATAMTVYNEYGSTLVWAGDGQLVEKSLEANLAENQVVYLYVNTRNQTDTVGTDFKFCVRGENDPFIFERNSDTVNEQTGGLTVAQYTGSDSVVTVNETYYNTTVTRIGEAAFKNNTIITTVYLPDTVQVIEKQAFMGCTNLSSMGISSPNSNG